MQENTEIPAKEVRQFLQAKQLLPATQFAPVYLRGW